MSSIHQYAGVLIVYFARHLVRTAVRVQ